MKKAQEQAKKRGIASSEFMNDFSLAKGEHLSLRQIRRLREANARVGRESWGEAR